MPPNYPVYLRSHSFYGFLESTLSPKALVQTAHEKGIRTLGLTDHLYLTGAIEFYEACHSASIKPILGLEIDFLFQDASGRLALLARDQKGWANLSALSSTILTQNQAININVLSEHRDGLICLLGGPKGILRELIGRGRIAHHLQ